MNTNLDIDLIRQHTPVPNLSNTQLTDLMSSCELQSLGPKRKLFKRGDQHNRCYFLIKGEVDLIDDNFKSTRVRAEAGKTALPLDAQEPHGCSAITASNCDILAVERDKMDLIMTWSQAGSYLQTNIEHTKEEEEDDGDWMSSLLQSSLLQMIPPTNLQQLFGKFQPVHVKAGEVIIKEGCFGEDFYVIESGAAEVRRKVDSCKISDAVPRLKAGQYFGEEALISESTRNASVVMLTEGKLMKLGKQDFKDLLQEPVISYLTIDQAIDLEMSSERTERIDVRMPIECKHGKTEGARNIPLSNIRNVIESLDYETSYIINCDGGRRSEVGAYLLTEAGYTAYVLRTADS